MTNEELQRMRQYADKINGAEGWLGALTLNESVDLAVLIKKRVDESTEWSEGKHVPRDK